MIFFPRSQLREIYREALQRMEMHGFCSTLPLRICRPGWRRAGLPPPRQHRLPGGRRRPRRAPLEKRPIFWCGGCVATASDGSWLRHDCQSEALRLRHHYGFASHDSPRLNCPVPGWFLWLWPPALLLWRQDRWCTSPILFILPYWLLSPFLKV